MSKRVFPVILALGSALLVLLIATSSSPLYATNFWADTNIYFTIGRGMIHGLAPYTDLFDHKGPLLFVIYALGALISDTSFLGVFALQVISLMCMLLIGYLTVLRFGSRFAALLSIPVSAMVTAASTAYKQGGSAEEFILPALALGIYLVIRRFEEGQAVKRTRGLYAALGASMAWVFAIKYTNCGLFFGLVFCVLLYEWRVNGIGRAVEGALWCAAGFAALLLPIAIYLAANGALGACLRVYFYENIFLYGGEPMTLGEHVYNALAYLRTQSQANPVMAALAMAGCAFLSIRALWRRKKGFLFEMAALPMAAGLLLLFTYWGEMAHPYYALVFAALSPLAFCALGSLFARLCVHAPDWTAILPLAAAVPVCIGLCSAVPMMDVKQEDMAQTRFAQRIAEDEEATLLDLTSLDQGFYLASGILPNCRYFVNNNLDTPEKKAALDESIKTGAAKYIVTSNFYANEKIEQHYTLIAQEDGVFEDSVARAYKLYQYGR